MILVAVISDDVVVYMDEITEGSIFILSTIDFLCPLIAATTGMMF